MKMGQREPCTEGGVTRSGRWCAMLYTYTAFDGWRDKMYWARFADAARLDAQCVGDFTGRH